MKSTVLLLSVVCSPSQTNLFNLGSKMNRNIRTETNKKEKEKRITIKTHYSTKYYTVS